MCVFCEECPTDNLHRDEEQNWASDKWRTDDLDITEINQQNRK